MAKRMNDADIQALLNIRRNLIVDHDNFAANYYKDAVYKFDIYSLGKSLIEIFNNFKNLFSLDLLDFLSKMVRYDYRLRPSVDELLEHPYIKSFKMVKTLIKKAPAKKAPSKKTPVKKTLLKKVSVKTAKKTPTKRKPVKKQSPKALNLGNKNNQTKKKRKTRSNKGVPRGKYKKKGS